jgi:DNA-directed RNA polymerase specialized sigma24 family protein
MAKLKPDCQQVILLFSQGVDYEEIAAKTGLKSGDYAKRKKYLCKEALMDFIKKDPEYRDHLDLK